ncbi:MAG: NAD(P)-binding domain-containing protein [Moorea sp. SIO3I7]|uniref:NAD(P)-binding domain-containing protein n=1 Tax=unclassified Moorena TaxID=2683338 RepID=UPI0013C06BAD|nr:MULTISPECIES: NAD(P)-binding domain-containing protein [unclassified Moorena]NEN96137.1 NAD(P)-binding domain-containing protein [Moorena sp. SIO3I7]NEO07659.1 NAD(P)-binding domain-containing protein [Moorena sp. SIO3I8]NEO19613.1 NAD(P)-binding domain-containing protein [Moorena sp. SIO4A5]NEQ59810.1 NAD(P)-binding domain-containing protein [Moorena sp. SIO4A1]
MKKINYGFIGTGIIGEMLINRFVDSGVADPDQIYASNRSTERLKRIVIYTGINKGTNQEVISNCDYIYLCVKPQDLPDVYQDLNGKLNEKTLVTSVASIERNSYYENLGKIKLVRIIPSITNKIKGTILFVADKSQESERVYLDLSQIANVYCVPEEHLDEYTHLASCSPAIISEFIRGYLTSITKKGINEEKGREIIFDALYQTADLLKEFGFRVIDDVCTKGGISRVGVNFVSENFPIERLSDELLGRMKSVKLEWSGKYELNNQNILDIINENGTPLYVYEENEIKRNFELIIDSIPYENKQVHYAVMCNSNSEVLRKILQLGGFVQINSIHELDLVKKVGFSNGDISFTSTGLDSESLERLVQEGVQVNLDSVEEVEKYCKLNAGGNFGIRIKMKEDIELPEGYTNSPKDSDVGIPQDYFSRVKQIAQDYGCRINEIHGYLASNILESEPLIHSSNYLMECAKQFPDLEYVNFGSGFGVPGRKTESKFDFAGIGEYYSRLTKELSDHLGRDVKLKIEPGRSVVATAGTLYAKVTNVKQLTGKKQISINAGFGEFPRPRIYGAYHEIEAVGKTGETETYDIRGNTVLQSDFLGKERKLPQVQEGDILAIRNTGAYGIVMASGFPGKELPSEVMVYSDGTFKRILDWAESDSLARSSRYE